MLQFRVLGSLSVIVDGRQIRVPAAKQRIAVATLLVNANQVVAADGLIEVVWNGHPPRSAEATLRSNMARLRRVLGPVAGARIDTRSPGYVISVTDDELDMLSFAAAQRHVYEFMRAASWQACADAAAAALAHWRGTPLCDVPALALQQDHVPRLIEQRLAIVACGLTAQLRLGRHVEALGELTELVASNPLREQLVELLMLALYRCGRQAESLEVYRDCRRRLVDELGIEPCEAVQRLQMRVLAGDPSLLVCGSGGGAVDTLAHVGPTELADGTGVPAVRPGVYVVPQQLPRSASHFVERPAELAALTGLLDHGSTGGSAGAWAGPICVITGVGGVGKTVLAVQWGHRVAERFTDGQVYASLRGFGPAGAPVSPAKALGVMLPALGVPPKRIPRGLAARAGLYRSLLANKRVLVVLDNARDEGQVRPLLPGSRTCMTIITSRGRLTGLLTSEGALPLCLDVLDNQQAHELLARRLGDQRLVADPCAVYELIRLCGALPLALSVAATRAQQCPSMPLAALTAEMRDVDSRLSALQGDDAATDVRALFSLSYTGLSRKAAEVFRLLGALPGSSITAATVAALTGMPPDAASAVLGQLAQVGLITEHGHGRFTCHDLLRAYAAERAAAEDRPAERDNSS